MTRKLSYSSALAAAWLLSLVVLVTVAGAGDRAMRCTAPALPDMPESSQGTRASAPNDIAEEALRDMLGHD